MHMEYMEGEFSLTMNRREVVMIISVLGWVDALVPSDQAFKDYVGWSRGECEAFTDMLADFYRSVPPGTPE